MADNFLNKTWARVVLGLVIFILLLIAVGYYLANNVLPDKIDAAMRNAVSENIGEQYKLEYDEMDIRLLAGDITLKAIRIYAPEGIDSAERHMIDSLSIAQVAVRGIDAFAYLFNKKIAIGAIRLERPSVWLRPVTQDTANAGGEKSKKSGKIESYAIGKFEINDARLLHYNTTTGIDTLHSIGSMDFSLFDIRYEPGQDPASIMEKVDWTKASLYMEQLVHKTAKGLFTFRLRSMDWSSDQDLVLKDFNMIPIPAKYEFHEIVGHQTDRITATVKNIRLNGLDVEKMIRAGNIDIKTIHVSDVDLNTFRDKRYPYPDVANSKMPKAILQRLPIVVHIDTVNVSNTKITYEEHPEKGDQTGHVYFTDLQGTITLISNDTARRKGKMMEIEASTYVMGKGKLEASVDFPYDKPAGVHSANGRMAMDLTAINTILEAYNVKINKGHAKSIDFNFEANDDFSTGKVILLYENLDIALPTASKAGFIGSILGEVGELGINQWIIKDKNTAEGEGPRVGTIDFRRDKRKSIFNYWWYTLESGMVECLFSESVYSLIKSAGVIDKMLYGGRANAGKLTKKEEKKLQREERVTDRNQAREEKREKTQKAAMKAKNEADTAGKKIKLKADSAKSKANSKKAATDTTEEDRNIFEKIKDKAVDLKDEVK